mmetsp:Transcript_110519/g.323342  ORF Transcript_110519/g.323342 Transcript_110519/m.323342 type:complete len:246 (+) Transcript_110519:154-891(+)
MTCRVARSWARTSELLAPSTMQVSSMTRRTVPAVWRRRKQRTMGVATRRIRLQRLAKKRQRRTSRSRTMLDRRMRRRARRRVARSLVRGRSRPRRRKRRKRQGRSRWARGSKSFRGHGSHEPSLLWRTPSRRRRSPRRSRRPPAHRSCYGSGQQTSKRQWRLSFRVALAKLHSSPMPSLRTTSHSTSKRTATCALTFSLRQEGSCNGFRMNMGDLSPSCRGCMVKRKSAPKISVTLLQCTCRSTT